MLTIVGRAAARRVQTTRLPSCPPTSAQLIVRQSLATPALPIRSFTLSAWAHQPAAGDKKAAKKTTTAKKTAATKTTTKSKSKSKPKATETKPKAKPKAKKATKKPKEQPKKKKVKSKKDLTPEQLEKRQLKEKKLEIKETKKWALNEKIAQLPASRWILYVSDQKSGVTGNGPITSQTAALAEKFRQLSGTEIKDLDDRSLSNREKNRENLEAWVKAHEPARIYLANKARRRLAFLTGKAYKRIHDDRLPERPAGPYAIFVTENYSRFTNPDANQRFKDIGQAWAELNADEKSRYEERHADHSAKYKAEMDKIQARAEVIKAAEKEVA
ncbi:hypothetical protein F66182_8255 [Fusarium sp. NRRL 66182]|nr:hypothetical protein F66182_8255 [Fusarium sp. NRRL 66182]